MALRDPVETFVTGSDSGKLTSANNAAADVVV
jgi:hypothetical protein